MIFANFSTILFSILASKESEVDNLNCLLNTVEPVYCDQDQKFWSLYQGGHSYRLYCR